MDKDLTTIKPYLKPTDRLLDLASTMTKNLGLTKLSETIAGSISAEGIESIRAMESIRENIKIKLTSLTNEHVSRLPIQKPQPKERV